MRIPAQSSLALRLAAVTMLVAVGSAVGCDVEDDLTPEELELLEADLDADLDEQASEDLTSTPDDAEPRPGVDAIDDFTAESDPTAFGWMGWHSEETPGASTCPANQVVTGFDCSGSYCDNVRLECHNYGGTVSGGSWSPWFEHNGKISHSCPWGQQMTGVDCWGDNCDNISIRCSTSSSLATDRCTWSAWYSEENPSAFVVPVGSAIRGVWCSGARCDNKRFLECEI